MGSNSSGMEDRYGHWSEMEHAFGEPVVHPFGVSEECTVTDRDPSPAGIEYGNVQVIEVVHALAVQIQEAAEPDLL